MGFFQDRNVKVAKDIKTNNQRRAKAIMTLADCELLFDLAKNKDNPDLVRSTAFNRFCCFITMSNILTEKENAQLYEREDERIKKLHPNPNIKYLFFCMNGVDNSFLFWIKEDDIKNIQDQEVLKYLACNQRIGLSNREFAVKMINDPALKKELEQMHVNYYKTHIQPVIDEQYQKRQEREREQARLRAKRIKEGRCPHCGVLLTGHPAYQALKDDPSYYFTCSGCGKRV